MCGYQVGEKVKTPVGIGTYKGEIRLHRQTLIVVSFLPEEVEREVLRMHGILWLNSLPEDQVSKVEETA